MTDDDIRHLGKTEMLRIIRDQEAELEQAKAKIEELSKALADKATHLENCGSIAEASLALNGVFQAAQEAADQYLAEIKEKAAGASAEAARIVGEAHDKADAQVREAIESAGKTESQGKEMAETYWQNLSEKLEAFYIQQRLNEQMYYARQNWDDENSRKYNTYQNTLSWYNNVKDVFGFHLDCATYVCDTSATVISNKGNFSTSSKTYEATDENTYHSSISGTLNNGDFALKKVDSAKEISGPIDSDTFNSVNGITGAEFEVDDASGNLLYFTGGAGEYTLSSSSTAGAVTTLAVNSGGCLKLAGLSYSTTYKIKETKAPDGYGVNTDQITFTVDGAKVNYFAFPDKAETGYTLPSTGGIGIAPFILAGFILTTIPLIITCWRRKKKRGGTYR